MEIRLPTLVATPDPVAELDRLGDEIAELSAHLDAATARLLDLIREFDARGGWNTGFRSCAAWLSWRVGLDLGAARERVRVARALGTLPLLGRGPRPRGAVVRQGPGPDPRGHPGDRSAAAGGGARGHGRPRRADRARLAVGGPAGRGAGDRAAAREPGAARATRTRTAWWCSGGGWSRRSGALLMQALAAARETLYQRARVRGRRRRPRPTLPRKRPTMAQQQADALALLAETALHHGLDPGAPGERYQVVVHVDAPALADPDQPGPVRPRGRRARFRGNVPAPGVRREPGGDAARRGRAHRRGRGPDPDDSPGVAAGAPPPRPGLPLPGLRRPFGQGHHLRHWAHGGPTTLSNLALLCRRHHRAVHEEGYQVERQPDGALRFRRPDGRPAARGPAAGRGARRSGRARSGRGTTRRGCACTRGRRCPGWLGERLDVGWAIDVLHPLAARPRPCPPLAQGAPPVSRAAGPPPFTE